MSPSESESKSKSKSKRPAPRPTGDRGIGTSLRDAIARSGRSTYALGRDAGVDPGAIQRFLSFERDLRLETAARLARELGLKLVESGSRRGKKAEGSQ